MKKVMLTLGVLLCTLLAVAQASAQSERVQIGQIGRFSRAQTSAQSENVIKLRAKARATYILGDLGPWKKCSALIVIDLNRELIKVHSDGVQEYYIVGIQTGIYPGSYRFDCMDQNRDEVEITYYTHNAPIGSPRNKLDISYGVARTVMYTVQVSD